MEWKTPLLAAAAALISGSAAMSAGTDDERVFAFSGLVVGALLLGVWLGRNK
jgi:hypothetical protein